LAGNRASLPDALPCAILRRMGNLPLSGFSDCQENGNLVSLAPEAEALRIGLYENVIDVITKEPGRATRSARRKGK